MPGVAVAEEQQFLAQEVLATVEELQLPAPEQVPQRQQPLASFHFQDS